MLLFRRVCLSVLTPWKDASIPGWPGGDQGHWGVFRDPMREGDPQPVSN